MRKKIIIGSIIIIVIGLFIGFNIAKTNQSLPLRHHLKQSNLHQKK